MINGAPLVLIASVSRSEGRLLERALESTGWKVLWVEDAKDAARLLEGGRRRAALLIDAGLLQMHYDAQWRDLRTHHPELGTIVRCLMPKPRLLPGGGATIEVHPDDLEAASEAIRSVCGSGPHRLCGVRSARSDRIASRRAGSRLGDPGGNP